MLDLGRIPRTIQAAVGAVCEKVDADISEKKKEIFIDTASEATVRQWATTLDIYTGGKNLEDLRTEVNARLNARGCVNVKWFYELAERLGYKKGKYGGSSWSFQTAHPYYGPGIYFTDGEFLPFRVGISVTGDKVYDNITYGATTCTVYYRKGNGEDFSTQLINLISKAKNMCTTLVFVDTEKRR